MPGELERHLRMEGMPVETPASVFSGESTGAVPARPLVARFGVRGLVSRTFEVRDDTVGGASTGAKTTTRARVEQRDSLPLSARGGALCSLIRAASTIDCLAVRAPLPVSRA